MLYTLQVLALFGTVLGVIAIIAIVFIAYCLKAYFENEMYSLNKEIWSLERGLSEVKPLPEENGLENGQIETNSGVSNQIEVKDIEAVLREKLPRYSVVYNGRSVDVFADVRTSQVYCIAQDYFQRSHGTQTLRTIPESPDTPSTSATERSTVVAIEHMDVYPISDSKEKSQACQRPESICDNIEEVLYSHNADKTGQIFPGMYMSKTIGPDGGSISIQGARLTIPVGALTVSTKIRLGVVWKSNGGPRLEEQQALLSSVVACEPHGLEFQVPVNLEIQHCAQMATQWELCIITSNTSVFESKYI